MITVAPGTKKDQPLPIPRPHAPVNDGQTELRGHPVASDKGSAGDCNLNGVTPDADVV